jgi:hypothetical protein
VVDRLLLTAEDLGAAGVDSVFGRGRLDLEAAMAPVGPLGLPLGSMVDGPSAPLEGAALELGAGMALDQADAAFLGRAMALDSMGFPFWIDLGERVRSPRRQSRLNAFFGGEGAVVSTAAASARQTALLPERNLAAENAIGSRLSPGDEPPPQWRFEAEAAGGWSVFGAVNQAGGPRLGLEAGLAERGVSGFETSALLSPYGALFGPQSGAGVGFAPADDLRVALSASASGLEEGGPNVSTQRFEIQKTVRDGVELRLGVGLIQEEGGALGGASAGAFGEDLPARSRFFSLAVLAPLADGVDWFGAYSRGRSSIGGDQDALLSNWSDPATETFAAGLLFQNVAKPGDGLSLLVGQPLRSERVEASVDLPVARAPSGAVVTERRRIDLAPDGREIATELSYRLPLGARREHEVRAGGYLRFNPDHDPDRPPESGLAIAYRWRF